MAAKNKANTKKQEKAQNTKKPQGAVKNTPPQPRWMKFTILAAAFLTFLIIVNQNADYLSKSTQESNAKTEPDSQSNASLQASVNKSSAQPQPNNQSDKFDFYEILEKDNASNVPEIENIYRSTPKSAILPTDKDYLIQAGSFRSQKDADRFRARLLLKGLEPYVKKIDLTTQGVWYRVYVGPYRNRSELNKAQDILAHQGVNAIVVQKSRTP